MSKNNIPKHLEKQGKSQLQLAREANMSPSDLSQVISGKKPCYPRWKKRISEALNVTEEELFVEV